LSIMSHVHKLYPLPIGQMGISILSTVLGIRIIEFPDTDSELTIL